MGIRTRELKPERETQKREFVFYISSNYQMLHWQNLSMDDEQVKEYLKENPFPKDKFYSEKDFLKDLTCEGFISVKVEKEDTKDYLCDLFYELV